MNKFCSVFSQLLQLFSRIEFQQDFGRIDQNSIDFIESIEFNEMDNGKGKDLSCDLWLHFGYMASQIHAT